MPFNLAYHEACKKPVGSIEGFEESNLELKKSVLCFLINKGYVIIKITDGNIFFYLTNKAIVEYMKKPREDWGWNPGKRQKYYLSIS